MTNNILFISSIINGIILFSLISYYKIKTGESANNLLILMVFIGVITSLWNHGTKSNLAKWCDRFTMLISSIILFNIINDSNISNKNTLIFLLLLGIGCYFISKLFNKDNNVRYSLHCGTHLIVTIILIKLIGLV